MNKSKGKRRGQTDSESSQPPTVDSLYSRSDMISDASLPPQIRHKLQDLFSQIEKEFELLYSENLHLQDKVDALNERLERDMFTSEKSHFSDKTNYESVDSENIPSTKTSKHKLGGSSQKLKTAHKLKAQTSKIVSSFKTPSVVCSVVKELRGHRDGVWDVDVARPGVPLIGTSSADHTACIWLMKSGKCALRYSGHSGSVNSIRFHPSKDLVLTSAGDQTAHIWQVAVTLDVKGGGSSEEEMEGGDGDGLGDTELESSVGGNFVPASLRTPVGELIGHMGVVAHADWMPGGEQVVTASWDRTAVLWDVETREPLHSLTGHDRELTHICTHHCHRLIVTSSKDTTFRLWDFREPIHSVSVFQGHTDTVTSAIFTKREDKIISGSDDRTVKVWDLKNMRSPLATIRSDSAVNKLAVSSTGIIAVPHDNRQVRLYDLTGQRVARHRQGHQRMVCSVAWADEHSFSTNFFSCGFDRLILGWSIQNIKDL